MRTRTLMTTVWVLALSAIALAQSVTYDFDRTADFDRFRTYAWVPGTTLADQLNHRRVVDAIDAQLAGKRLQRVGVTVNPDLHVAYHASFDRDIEITAFRSGWGPRFGGSGSARAQEVVTGTLVVDIIDARTGAIVWRGMASRDLDVTAGPDKREKNINKAAAKLLKSYPPKS